MPTFFCECHYRSILWSVQDPFNSLATGTLKFNHFGFCFRKVLSDLSLIRVSRIKLQFHTLKQPFTFLFRMWVTMVISRTLQWFLLHYNYTIILGTQLKPNYFYQQHSGAGILDRRPLRRLTIDWANHRIYNKMKTEYTPETRCIL